MAPRANWKGFLKIAELSCPVAIHTAASAAERVSFNTINRDTGHKLHREFVDTQTGKPVPKEEQVKGYETAPGEYIMLEPEEIAAAVPQSDKTLTVGAFITCEEIDDVYFDKPYFLAPDGKHGADAYALIRDGMRESGVAALAQTVLFRRLRTVLIRPHGKGMIATTLHYDYEIRRAEEAFSDIPEIKIQGEMLKLAEHIIETKKGAFDPASFDDRYEAALAELIKAKMEGREIAKPKPVKHEKVIDLMEALRQSAEAAGKQAKGAGRKAPSNAPAKSSARQAKPTDRKGGPKRSEPRRKAG
jgi:DNA end-binding protein Ku